MTECVHGAFMVFIVVGLDIPVETSVYENFSLSEKNDRSV